MTRALRALIVAALIAPSLLLAQRGRGGGGGGRGYYPMFGDPNEYYTPPDFHGNPLYDGRFVFARLKYRGYLKWAGREGPGWSHDYPDAEEKLMRIMREVTTLRPFIRTGEIAGGAIVGLDDPALFKYPVGYLSEPGGWYPNDKEVKGLHDYLLKGGFVIFDDFREGGRWGYDWSNLRQQMAKVLPGAKWIQLHGDEPIFDSFFKIDLRAVISPTVNYGINLPTYFALYQDNDPNKHMLVIANVDSDIGEAWQWSGTGFVAVPAENEAFKLGVNYLVYALTH